MLPEAEHLKSSDGAITPDNSPRFFLWGFTSRGWLITASLADTFNTENLYMNIKKPAQKHDKQPMNGKVAAVMRLVNAERTFESYFLYGDSNPEHRYINASSQNSDYIVFTIPATWGLGPHDLKSHPKVIKFEPSLGFPNDPESWYAQRGEVFITDISDKNFEGRFTCYGNPIDGEDKPALIGGTFKIDFTPPNK